jgi:hypothetical protein
VKAYREAHAEYTGEWDAEGAPSVSTVERIRSRIARANGEATIRTSAEVIVGYRVWRAVRYDTYTLRINGIRSDVREYTRLYSAHQRVQWVPGEPMKGTVDELLPMAQLGVHAYAQAGRDLLDEMTHFAKRRYWDAVLGGYDVVVGTVSLWGKSAICAKGYRSERGYPLDLCYTTSKDPTLLQRLARLYGCNVWTPPVLSK